MFFAVLGKNSEISLTELEYAKPTNLKPIRNNIITFDSDFPDRIKQLGWIIKRGSVVDKEEMIKRLAATKIIGVNDENLGKKFKSEYGVRRFKLVKLFHTDKEIKEKWVEIIQINKEQFGIVEGYQAISLYEEVDFEKPARSMQMWMMPAKLSHIMLNIGLTHVPSENITLYDPFIGTWTTGFLANHFWYDFMGSDIDTSYAEKNKQRRFTHKLANPDKKFELFTHDIHDKFTQSLNRTNILIITEWRLGPIITAKSTPKDVQSAQNKVTILYESFLTRISELKIKNPKLVTICTIPYYTWQSNTLESKLQEHTKKIWLNIHSIPEIYARKDQLIGRKILIIK